MSAVLTACDDSQPQSRRELPFPQNALLQDGEVDDLEEVAFLPNDSKLGDQCGIPIDDAWQQASVTFAEGVSEQIATATFLVEWIIIFPDDATATAFMEDIHQTCDGYAGADWDIAAMPQLGDQAISFRYSIPWRDSTEVFGHHVFVRVSDAVISVSDTWDENGGLGRDRVEHVARDAFQKFSRSPHTTQ